MAPVFRRQRSAQHAVGKQDGELRHSGHRDHTRRFQGKSGYAATSVLRRYDRATSWQLPTAANAFYGCEHMLVYDSFPKLIKILKKRNLKLFSNLCGDLFVCPNLKNGDF